MKLLLILALLFTSCHPLKKALRVARENPNEFSGFCAETFPVGEIVTVKDSVRFDTLYLQSDPVIEYQTVNDTVYKMIKSPGTTYFVTKTVTHDSLIIKRDRAAEKTLELQRDNLIVSNKDIISQRDGFKKGRDWWRIACLITWTIVGLWIVWKVWGAKYFSSLKILK